jgi:hypothetical protein
MLPFYAYLNWLFRRTMTPGERDGTKILAYNKNILAAMTPMQMDLCSPFFIHMGRNKGYLEESTQELWICSLSHVYDRESDSPHNLFEKEHHPLRIKNDLRAPVEDRRAAAPWSSPPKAARGREQQGDKPPSPIRKIFSLLFGMCKSKHAIDVKAQHERHERKKITKSVKEIHTHLDLQPPSSSIASDGEESPKIESFEERIAHFNEETPV